MTTAQPRRTARRHWGGRLTGMLCSVALLSCGGSEESPPGAGDDEPGGSSGGSKKPNGGVSTAEENFIDEPTEAVAGPGTLAPECARDINEAERAKINLHLVVDISGSMRAPISADATRWHAVRDAIAEFIVSPASAGIDLALSYYPIQEPRTICAGHNECLNGLPCHRNVCLVELAFGDPVYCEPDSLHPIPALNQFRCTVGITLDDGTVVEPQCIPPSFCSDAPTKFCLVDEDCEAGTCDLSLETGVCPGTNSCDVAAYAVPAVEKKALPAAAMAIVDSLGVIEPDEFARTPTHVALAGAYQHTAKWLEDEPGSRSFVVLATDGFPDGCETLDAFNRPLATAADATLAALETGVQDKIDTFVIGVVDDEFDPDGQARAQLLDMAKAGGTEEAFIVTADETVATGFLSALDAIRGGLPCEYNIPAPEKGVTDLDLVNVEIKVADALVLAPRVASAADCPAGEHAWHYDDGIGTDAKIVLCPQACQDINEVEDTRVDVVLGCKTVIKIK